MNRSLVVLLLAVASGLSSCASPVDISRSEYPRDWPPLEPVADGSCPNIAGLYQDVPAAGCKPEDWFSCRLTYALLAPLLTPSDKELRKWQDEIGKDVLDSVTHVQINQPANGILEVLLLRSDRGLVLRREELSLDKGQFACSSEGLVITKTAFSVPVVAAVYDHAAYTFRSDAGHSLVMSSDTTSTGLALVIPVYFQHRHWSHWDRLAGVSSKSPQTH
jgi:hypothetical protein